MSRPRPRLKEIAEATGFSVNTVSLALRGSDRIPEKTRDLIMQEAERQNYFPNQIARSLTNRATHTIGLVLTDIMNPTITLTARSIERLLANAGYGVMFATSDNSLENEKKAMARFQSHQVDGIIVYPTNRSKISHIQAARDAGFPVLALADLPDSGLQVVAMDDRVGAETAVGHLVARGHKNIVLLDGAFGSGNTEKFDGAQKALKRAKNGAASITVVDPKGNSSAHGYAVAATILNQTPRPTAVFATTDALAIGVARWCLENEISIPEDLAIVGYDNSEVSEFGSTPLTTINYASDEVSQQAVERIIALIESETRLASKTLLIEPNIVVRKSS
ncbi:MAG: LacI family DNA-binding transcriptional regulator [Marinosulfonomonas sp.]